MEPRWAQKLWHGEPHCLGKRLGSASGGRAETAKRASLRLPPCPQDEGILQLEAGKGTGRKGRVHGYWGKGEQHCREAWVI
jgi:hypothetical protein